MPTYPYIVVPKIAFRGLTFRHGEKEIEEGEGWGTMKA